MISFLLLIYEKRNWYHWKAWLFFFTMMCHLPWLCNHGMCSTPEYRAKSEVKCCKMHCFQHRSLHFSSYVNVVSLESLIIPLYNDVSFVMFMQSWNAQSFWICSKVKNEMLQNSLFSIVNSRLFWGWIEFEWCWCGDAWKSTHGVFSSAYVDEICLE